MKTLKYHIIVLTTFLLATGGYAEIGIDIPDPVQPARQYPSATGEDEPKSEPTLQPLTLTIGLVDGSHIIGVPGIKSVPVQTDYARMDIPLRQIVAIEVNEDHETASVNLHNGDKLKGTLSLGRIELVTVFGKVSVGIEHITTLRVTLGGRALPAGEGSLSFGGVNWKPWRTMFEVRGDKLVSLPKARPGFNYGHSGNGRGATLMTNIGSKNWKDYRIDLEFGMRGVDPALNPHGLPLSYRSGSIVFHVADAKESWNERGSSRYYLNLSENGDWSLGCAYSSHCQTARGYGSPTNDGNRSLANGSGLKLDPKAGNKIRIDVRGKHIQVWVDGERIADVQDDKMGEPIGGQTLDHGGVGVTWGWECMGWIRNFSAEQL
jgi:hypothetical protein